MFEVFRRQGRAGEGSCNRDIETRESKENWTGRIGSFDWRNVRARAFSVTKIKPIHLLPYRASVVNLSKNRLPISCLWCSFLQGCAAPLSPPPKNPEQESVQSRSVGSFVNVYIIITSQSAATMWVTGESSSMSRVRDRTCTSPSPPCVCVSAWVYPRVYVCTWVSAIDGGIIRDYFGCMVTTSGKAEVEGVTGTRNARFLS